MFSEGDSPPFIAPKDPWIEHPALRTPHVPCPSAPCHGPMTTRTIKAIACRRRDSLQVTHDAEACTTS
jgi:hypothetical protein